MSGIGLYTSGLGWTYEELRLAWMLADDLGFDSAHIMDNVVGPVPRDPSTAVFETFTVLPALAEATTRIRFGPMVSPCGRRHPALFAKMTSVLDVISGGRLILAMGCGDEDRHFTPWGLPYPSAKERIAILDEEIQVIKRMWVDDLATFEGEHFKLDRAISSPKPIQSPHPPLWIGLNFGRNLMPALAAKHADGINIYIGPDKEAAERLQDLRRCCDEIGRDFETITKSRHILLMMTDDEIPLERLIREQSDRMGLSEDYLRQHYGTYVRLVVGPPEKCREQLVEQLALGFDYLLLQFQGPLDSGLGGDPSTAMEAMPVFAKEILPALITT